MDAVDVLMEARAYIEKGWCQGTAALAWQGKAKVNANHPQAESWCSGGALLRAVEWEPTLIPGDMGPPAFEAALSLFREVIGAPEFTAWNDAPGRTQADVLEAFDRAIGLGLERAGER